MAAQSNHAPTLSPPRGRPRARRRKSGDSGAGDGRRREGTTKRQEPENFLARYFKEMATLSVLQPEEEFEAARRIESIEVALWTHLLSYPPIVEALLAVVEQELEEPVPGATALRRAARGMRGRPNAKQRDRYVAQCERVAQRQHAQDVDRRGLFAALNAVNRIARGEKDPIFSGRARANTKSKAFTDYRRRVRIGFGRSQRARNEFVKANLRLVVSIARRFNHGRMPLSDLIQEGNIGLIKAVERYDYRRGYRFSTYASWWIRHSISRALADKGRAVRLPVHMIDAYHKVTRTKRELSNKLGRPPTSEEVSDQSGIAPEKVEKLQGYLMEQAVSLDREVADGDGRRFVDMIEDPDAQLPSDHVMDQAINDQVREYLERELKPIEADILRKRFGLGDGQELTLKEIGQKYNLSRERIRQLQEQALMKIRRALQRQD